MTLTADDPSIMALATPRRSSTKKRRRQKYRSLSEIMKTREEKDDYADAVCVKCGSGDDEHQLLLCDKCDQAYHMGCLQPVVVCVPIGSWYCPTCSDRPQPSIISGFSRTMIFDFFGVDECWSSPLKRITPQVSRKRKRGSSSLVLHKKKRRLLPYVPSEDPDRRLQQMESLASALKSHNLEYSDELTYLPGMAPRSANQASFEVGGIMQVLSKNDTETLEECRAMAKRGEFPPLLVVYDTIEGYTVQADGPIKDLTLVAEFSGDVDYLEHREEDDSDSIMTLLLANNSTMSLVICLDKRGNITRLVNGINNHKPESKKKKNLKCVRYNVGGECRVLLIATRDIVKGERLYYDYNGYENAYPTHHFV